jgi:hypothetical protein
MELVAATACVRCDVLEGIGQNACGGVIVSRQNTGVIGTTAATTGLGTPSAKYHSGKRRYVTTAPIESFSASIG